MMLSPANDVVLTGTMFNRTFAAANLPAKSANCNFNRKIPKLANFSP